MTNELNVMKNEYFVWVKFEPYRSRAVELEREVNSRIGCI